MIRVFLYVLIDKGRSMDGGGIVTGTSLVAFGREPLLESYFWLY
jgi:hypothetical protein